MLSEMLLVIKLDYHKIFSFYNVGTRAEKLGIWVCRERERKAEDKGKKRGVIK